MFRFEHPLLRQGSYLVATIPTGSTGQNRRREAQPRTNLGTVGEAPYPVQTALGVRTQMVKVEIDEKTLTQIAQITGGRYFRATNNKALVEIYKEIDQMEKTKMSVQEYSKKQEEYGRYAMWAMIFFLLEILLRYTILKNIP
ncbi:MAG: hypothetical protein LBG45_07620 [Dysgonamonadaceae bacterium]|jgi:Ca-activated chloride channel family protein|nr:hypothetical protein [Dysgonamonadaceae bacterium]